MWQWNGIRAVAMPTGHRTGRLQICPERDKVWMLIVSLQSARSETHPCHPRSRIAPEQARLRLSLLLHAALDSRRRNCRIATPLSFPPSVLILHSQHVPASETAGLHLSRLFPPARRNCCSPPSRPPTIKIIQKNY